MKLINIAPGCADVSVAGIIYGHVSQKNGGPGSLSWIAYDKEGHAIGDETYGWPKRSWAADAVIRHYRELAAKS